MGKYSAGPTSTAIPLTFSFDIVGQHKIENFTFTTPLLKRKRYMTKQTFKTFIKINSIVIIFLPTIRRKSGETYDIRIIFVHSIESVIFEFEKLYNCYTYIYL